MKYTKPPLSYEQQADLILSRGLAADKQELVEKLKAVNYYRLSGYLYPFQNLDDTFKPRANLQEVWRRYVFDRQLRLLVLDAIERIEISARTSLVYLHSHEYGGFGYLNGSNLPNLNKNEFILLKGKLADAVKKSKEPFVSYFLNKYGDKHTDLPIWMLAELMSFGMMFTFFRGVGKQIKKDIANEYGIRFGVFESWLFSLNAIRNICAHHGRLWNRVLGIKPLIPAKEKQWHDPVVVSNDRMFCILTLLRYMLKIVAPQSRWKERLQSLMDSYNDIPVKPMGFPKNWKDCPIWK